MQSLPAFVKAAKHVVQALVNAKELISVTAKFLDRLIILGIVSEDVSPVIRREYLLGPHCDAS